MDKRVNATQKQTEPDEKPPVRAVDFLYGVFFLGILLSFALYVSVTALLGRETTVGDTYLTGRDYRIPISDFSEAYYKNITLQDIITQYDFRLFGKVEDKNVLVGKGNFLFEAVRQENNYNYLRDFLGEYAYDEESLESIYQFLKMRQTAYNNQGVEYIVAVIPNSQTVYSDYLPNYFQNSAGKTRLEQLSEYMKTKDDVKWINLSDALLAARSFGTVYNNTEDSLNSLGQYFVYQALYNALPEQVKAGTRLIPFEDVTLYTHHTPGKTLADRAGLSAVVKNETVSLSNTMEFNYLLQELYSGVEITYAGHNATGATAGQTILLDFSNEWDKIQLMPYFSSTFDDVVYKSDHDFSLLTVETAQPTLVIQFIHEYEINSFTNSNTAQTYSDGLKAGENPFTTAAPIVTGQLWLDDSTVCLSGWVEAGSELTVSGDAAEIRTLQVGPEESLFFILIEMADEDEVTVRLQASVAEKSRSKVEKIAVTRTSDQVEQATDVVVGDMSRLFATEPKNTILPDTGTLSVMEAEIRNYTDRVRSRVIYKDPAFINVVIPRSYSVYRGYAPAILQPTLQKTQDYRETVNELYRSCGWDVIDLTEAMRGSMDIGKLYGLTFDRWTDYGAYVGYRTVMSHIQKDFPDIELHELDDYTPVTQITSGGELAAALGFAPETISETQIRLNLDTPEVIYPAAMTDRSETYITIVENGALPVAIVLRDSEGSDMLQAMASHFRVMIVLPEGETEIDDGLLTLFAPDYVIRLASETAPGLHDMKTDVVKK